MTISITITDDPHQTIAGIPDSVVITTNVPSTIFYTLDGSVPNTFSPIYISKIILPTNLLKLILSIYATNGSDHSAIITKEYDIDPSLVSTTAGDRLPRAAYTQSNNSNNLYSLFPYGTNSSGPTSKPLNPSKAGITTYDPLLPSTPIGFDGSGISDGYVNKNNLSFKYSQIYSKQDREGQVLSGTGNLPAKVDIIGKSTEVQFVQEQSHKSEKIFNPKAMVIFTDSTADDPTNPTIIMRSSFSLEPLELTKDGALNFTTSPDTASATGSFIRSFYNARTNTYTSYFYDNSVNRWIIQSTPYQPTTQNVGSLSNMVFSDRLGPHVYQWKLFLGRYLG